jgi:carboxymethylenebutenolidase
VTTISTRAWFTITRLSRRTFGLAAAALGGVAATSAGAQSPVVEKDVEIKTPDGVADAALYLSRGQGQVAGGADLA